KQLWGTEGLKDFFRWPLLPLGRMTDGELIPEVAPEEGLAPQDQEASRQDRRISDFIRRMDERYENKTANGHGSSYPLFPYPKLIDNQQKINALSMQLSAHLLGLFDRRSRSLIRVYPVE